MTRMYNIEEKGPVSQNGRVLSNGLDVKETEDTWADLDNAIDNELDGCSVDTEMEKKCNSKPLGVDVNGGQRILKETDPEKDNVFSNPIGHVLVNKADNAVKKAATSFETNGNSGGQIEANGIIQPIDERLTDEILDDDSIPEENSNIRNEKNDMVEICKNSEHKNITLNHSEIISKANATVNGRQKNTDIEVILESNVSKSNISQDRNSGKCQNMVAENNTRMKNGSDDLSVGDKTNEFDRLINSTKHLSGPKTSSQHNSIASKTDASSQINRELVKNETNSSCSETKKKEMSIDSNNRKGDLKEHTYMIKNDCNDHSDKTEANDIKSKDEVDDSVNYDTALQKLSNISQYAKLLDDDHVESLNKQVKDGTPSSSSNSNPEPGKKRSHGEASKEDHSKRPKTVDDGREQEAGEDVAAAQAYAAGKATKKQLKRLSRHEMEDLVARKVVEVISCRSEIGELRAKCDKYEEMNEKWKRKTQALQKMCQDLNTVIKRYILDVKNKKDNPTPIKITRSVGLQVLADQRRRVPVHSQQFSQAQRQVVPQRNVQVQSRSVANQPVATRVPPAVPSHQPGNSKPVTTSVSTPQTNHVQIAPVTSAVTNTGVRVNQISPHHPLNKLAPHNPSPVPSSMVTISPSGKGYPPTAVVTSAPAQVTLSQLTNNPVHIRSSVSNSSGGNFQVSVIKEVVQPQSSLINLNIPATVTVSKTPVSDSNTSRLASAAAAPNKVIDLVELSDEEDGGPPSPIAPPLQQSQPVPASRSQQVYITRPAVTQNSTQSLANYHNKQTINRNQSHIANSPRSVDPSAVLNAGGIRPMVFANQMANGVNVQRPTMQGIGIIQHNRILPLSHPAPLPEMPNPQPHAPSWKKIPPKPTLKISRLKSGIVLSWNMDVIPTEHAAVASYQIYAYQEGSAAPHSGLWKKVGDVKALPLPMACTLTQFTKGNKYHFAVRAQDVHSRVGPYSIPQSIALT